MEPTRAPARDRLGDPSTPAEPSDAQSALVLSAPPVQPMSQGPWAQPPPSLPRLLQILPFASGSGRGGSRPGLGLHR